LLLDRTIRLAHTENALSFFLKRHNDTSRRINKTTFLLLNCKKAYCSTIVVLNIKIVIEPASTRSAKADRAARRAATGDDTIPSPPKHEKKVLLQGLVKLVEEEKLKKVTDYGFIADIVKTRQVQYPWLKREMTYYLQATLDTIVKNIIIDMGWFPIGRQAQAFKHAFDEQQAKPHLQWLDKTFVHFLFRQEWNRQGGCRPQPLNRTPPPPSPNPLILPPTIERYTLEATGVELSSERTVPSAEGTS
jgi:hypothetical protein